MSIATYPPQKLATVELLTQEIAFENPQKIVAEINYYHEKNTQYDAEYYDWLGPHPVGEQSTLLKVMEILEKQLQRTAAMEFHALVRVPSEKEAIPRIGDAILLRQHLLNALEVVKDLTQCKQTLTEPSQQCYLEYFIQRWIYKFCRHIFDWEKLEAPLVANFKKEQQKGKEGFQNVISILAHLSQLHSVPNATENGYNPANMRRFYVVCSNLLLAYLKQGISLPFNLQRTFEEFHKNTFYHYEDFSQDDVPTQAERHCLLIAPKAVKPFFVQLKSINTMMKRAVLFGMMVEPERKFAIGHFFDLSIKSVADLYQSVGNQLTTNTLETQGKQWLLKTYQTITEVMEEKKVLENQEILLEIQDVFISTQTSAASFAEELSAKQNEPAHEAETPPESPQPVDIPNLVDAHNLEELQDKGATKRIAIVQDTNVLELVVKNWEIRQSLTFPELIELVRIPFQILQNQSPGLREGRKFVSFAYLIALGLDEEHIHKFVEKLAQVGQISEERATQLQRLYPSALSQIGDLAKLNTDARPLFSAQGYVIPNIFIEKCEALQKIFMHHYSYIQSLLSYWIIVEEIYYSIARSTALMGTITAPTPETIEGFVESNNEDYLAAYEKALTFAGPLKSYFHKKYDAELKQQFVNVKIKNDLIALSQITPLNLAERWWCVEQEHAQD